MNSVDGELSNDTLFIAEELLDRAISANKIDKSDYKTMWSQVTNKTWTCNGEMKKSVETRSDPLK